MEKESHVYFVDGKGHDCYADKWMNINWGVEPTVSVVSVIPLLIHSPEYQPMSFP